MTIRLFFRWLNISYLTESNIINRIVQKETVVFYRWEERGRGEIKTKIRYNIRDTLALQPPPQALRFSHGRGERETSDW